MTSPCELPRDPVRATGRLCQEQARLADRRVDIRSIAR
jgi:hypothetical protein